MTLVARHAVVGIPADVGVVEIGGVVVPMADGALELRIVAGNNVASRANAAGAAMIHVEPRVREGRARPGRRVMAVRTGGEAEPGAGNQRGGDVVRHLCAQGLGAQPFIHMAAGAGVRRRCGTGVAEGAGRIDVRPGEREAGAVVVKHRAQPGRRRVARRTSGRITGTDVVGNGSAERRGALPLSDMAAVAIGGQIAGITVRSSVT